jgi:hypothetical protein
MATLAPIIPAARRDAFDDPAWLFDLKLDGFRGLADTIAGRILSKNGNQNPSASSKFPEPLVSKDLPSRRKLHGTFQLVRELS